MSPIQDHTSSTAPAPESGAETRDRGRRALEVNGTLRDLVAGATIADLVSEWCTSPDGIAVARNREVVPRSLWASTALEEGDKLEILSAVAGG